MPIPTAVSKVLVRLLNVTAHHLGERLGQALGEKSSTPVMLEQVKSDPRYVEAQIEYLKRKNTRERELASLSAAKVDWRIQLQEQELQDRRELSLLQRELISEWQAKAIQIKLNEIQMLGDKDAWFSKISLPDTEQILQRQQHRLLLLVAPPRISKDCPDSFHNNLTIELSKIGEFLNNYYCIHAKICPIEFYSDYFKCPISDLDVKRLQPILNFVPTAIIYSDLSDYEVNLRLGFWGPQNNQVFLLPTLAWNWEKVQEELEADGYSIKESLRTIRSVIVTIHKLLAAFLADAYYLYIDPNYEPQLFELDSELEQEWVKPYIKVIKEIQQQQRENYQQELKKVALIEASRREEKALKDLAEKWRCVYTIAGHANWVCAMAISADGKTLASGSSDNTVKLWNLHTGQEIGTLLGHLERVDAVNFSSDGKTLASSSSDNTVKLWSWKTQQEICTITGNMSRVFPIIISQDRKTTEGKEEKTIKLWDLTMGQEIHPIKENSNRGFPPKLSPDGEACASSSCDNAIALWNLKTGEEICPLLGHSRWVNSVAFSPDGKMLASASSDETIKLWDLKTGTEIRTLLGHTHWVNSVTFSADGKTLASGSMDRTIKLWSRLTGQEIRTITGHAGGVITVTISLDGNTLVSGSTDGIIKIWRCD